ncbi:hypothetical protein Dtox_1635 [Desulfofarcimen acetoxidans DSM 771]|uniref:Uncharacterized protein n=2 Tax=Desulfofarcimen acetoxidans TaxID=58138 RepID=C8VWE0_DESAS|nr:hypothetical protein Dtox_1635 [Desulfofarcimen acetoxidans DSM 771]
MALMNEQRIKIGSQILLWPGDTYPKHGIVRKLSGSGLTVELTYVHIKDPNGFKTGDLVNLPWSKVRVHFDKGLV